MDGTSVWPSCLSIMYCRAKTCYLFFNFNIFPPFSGFFGICIYMTKVLTQIKISLYSPSKHRRILYWRWFNKDDKSRFYTMLWTYSKFPNIGLETNKFLMCVFCQQFAAVVKFNIEAILFPTGDTFLPQQTYEYVHHSSKFICCKKIGFSYFLGGFIRWYE